MPIKSKAQRRKFAQLLMEGKILPETFEEWNRAAGSKKLPERLHPKRVVKKKRKVESAHVRKTEASRARKSRGPARRRRRPGRNRRS
jgi:hypothetical protein